jgi:hypothetical protein
LSFFGHDALYDVLVIVIAVYESHPDTVLARGRQPYVTLLGELLAQEGVRDLEHDPRTVTGLWLAARRAPVREVAQDFQTLFYRAALLLAVYPGYKAQTASIVLIRRVIKTGVGGCATSQKRLLGVETGTGKSICTLTSASPQG